MNGYEKLGMTICTIGVIIWCLLFPAITLATFASGEHLGRGWECTGYTEVQESPFDDEELYRTCIKYEMMNSDE